MYPTIESVVRNLKTKGIGLDSRVRTRDGSAGTYVGVYIDSECGAVSAAVRFDGQPVVHGIDDSELEWLG